MNADQAYRDNFKLIDWSTPIVTVKPERSRGARSDLPCPMLVRDDIGAVKSMQDGKFYDSRSALYRSYKDQGVRIMEAGEEPSRPQRPPVTKAEIAEAVQKVKQGYKPDPLPTSVLPEDE